ncbi:MAG: branched chain amino acid aminotransferase, partial [Lentisphaeria bacterium]|nr:branched chain amino acid aminotransferase [Lentisphaeria bacterium]
MATQEQLNNIRTDIDWGALGFSYMPVRSHIRCSYKDGKWNSGVLMNEHTITMTIAATCLHYGQAAFEGLKAFRCKDGTVKVFRPDENARRLNLSASRILGPEIPVEQFCDLVRRVVLDNIDYVPPYGSGGSLYIRPLYIGTGPQIGVAPSKDYELLIMVMPVGPYYKGGMKPVPALVIEDYDRAAP